MNPLRESRSSSRAGKRSAGWALAATALTLAHFYSFYDAGRPILTDTRYYLHFAREIAQGAVPHLDYFDNKTQLASFVGALFLQLGRLCGLDALVAIRLGYIGLAALAGLLFYRVFVQLAGGRSSHGFFGLIPYLGFAYVATLPTVGNVPKLIVTICASAAALSAGRGLWFRAGLLGGLAVLDWQIGVLVALGVVVAAGASRDRRSALPRTLLGGGAVVLAVVLYYGANGALDEFLRQTVAASFARAGDDGGQMARISAIQGRILMHCKGELWIVFAAGVGLLLFPFALSKRFASRSPETWIVLAVHHFGICAFSLLDFQGSGDTLILLHTLAFFGGVALVGLTMLLDRLVPAPRLRRYAQPALLGFLLIVARPVFAKPARLATSDVSKRVELADQVAYARTLEQLIGDRSLLVLGPSEMLFLGDFNAVSPYVYWNTPTSFEYGKIKGVAQRYALPRVLFDYQPAFLLAKKSIVLPTTAPYRAVVIEPPEGYRIRVYRRTNASAARSPD